MPAEPKKVERDANLFVPSDLEQRPRYEAAFRKFCSVFPGAFYISERGRTYADQEREKEKGRGGRLLNAGFHSMTGYFRDQAAAGTAAAPVMKRPQDGLPEDVREHMRAANSRINSPRRGGDPPARVLRSDGRCGGAGESGVLSP